MTGHVRAQRDRFQHPLFAREKFCRGYAWDWLVAQAAWQDTRIMVKGTVVALRRGQLSYSVRFLAERWGWSKSVVDRFLGQLKNETMIGTDTGTGQLIITICNYDKYQTAPDAGGTASGTPPGTGAGQERDRSGTNKKKGIKEEGKEEDSPPTPQGGLVRVDPCISEFEKVWPHYPRKVGVAQARKAWDKARRRATYDEIAQPLKACIRSWSGTPPDKIPHFATWLNRDGWLDDPAHAANRSRTSTEDIASLSRVSAKDDIDSLFAGMTQSHLRIAK